MTEVSRLATNLDLVNAASQQVEQSLVGHPEIPLEVRDAIGRLTEAITSLTGVLRLLPTDHPFSPTGEATNQITYRLAKMLVERRDFPSWQSSDVESWTKLFDAYKLRAKIPLPALLVLRNWELLHATQN